MTEFIQAATASAARIRDKLLHGPAQQLMGMNQGAVAGAVQADGSALYIYGEITGYYLHWLASLPDAPKAPAQAAANWLQNYLHSADMPLTRIYLQAAEPDWRNQALFAFDLAMIAGGLTRASTSNLISLSPILLADLQSWLLLFVGDAGLKVCIPRSSAAQLPQRWSTQGGSFTAKTASRILMLHAQSPLDASLAVACQQELHARATQAGKLGLDMIHPTLYALEGCMTSASADHEQLARWFEQILALQAADGSLPESLLTMDVRRTDIIAQALRMAIFLERSLSQPGRYRTACDGFAQALLPRIRQDGSMGFCTDNKPEANIWCAMFTEQALRLYAAYLQDQPLPFAVEALV